MDNSQEHPLDPGEQSGVRWDSEQSPEMPPSAGLWVWLDGPCGGSRAPFLSMLALAQKV